jgi:hypothetical protein
VGNIQLHWILNAGNYYFLFSLVSLACFFNTATNDPNPSVYILAGHGLHMEQECALLVIFTSLFFPALVLEYFATGKTDAPCL